MTTAELIKELQRLDPTGEMIVVSSSGDDIYTVDDRDVDIFNLYKVNDRGLWTGIAYPSGNFPGPFRVVNIG